MDSETSNATTVGRPRGSAGTQRRGVAVEDAFPRNGSPTPMSKTPVPSKPQQSSPQQTTSLHGAEAPLDVVNALDDLLKRGDSLRTKMSHALSGAPHMAPDTNEFSGHYSPVEHSSRADPSVSSHSSILNDGAPRADGQFRMPTIVNELQGRRDHVGELVNSILPDASSFPDVDPQDLVRVYAIQCTIHELNLSMPSALMSQMQSAVAKKGSGHSERWTLVYQLPVTSPVGAVSIESFTIPLNGSRLFECSGIGSSFNIRLDLDTVKVHPLLFDAPMARAWASGTMSFELRLGRKAVCLGGVDLQQCIAASSSAAQSRKDDSSTAAHSIVVPLVEAEELRNQAKDSRTSPSYARRRNIAGYTSRKHSQGVMASVTTSTTLLKQSYVMPVSTGVAVNPQQSASQSVKSGTTNEKTAPQSREQPHSKPQPKRQHNVTIADKHLPLFLQVHVKEVRTTSSTATGQCLTLATTYTPFTCDHINPTESFQFDSKVEVLTCRSSEFTAFDVNDKRTFPCGILPLTRTQRKHFVKGFMIFEFSTRDDTSGSDIFIGLAKIHLKPFYQAMREWVMGLKTMSDEQIQTANPCVAVVARRCVHSH